MDGTYDFSKIDGEMHYEDRTLTYAFRVHGESRADIEQKCSDVREWLTSAVGAELYDDDFPEYHFTNVTASAFGDLEYVSRNGRNATFIVTFSAAPYMVCNSGKTVTAFELTPTVSAMEYYLYRDTNRVYYARYNSGEPIYYKEGGIVAEVSQSSYNHGIIVDAKLSAADYDHEILEVPNEGLQQFVLIDGVETEPEISGENNSIFVITAENAEITIRHVFDGTKTDDEIAAMHSSLIHTAAGAGIGAENLAFKILSDGVPSVTLGGKKYLNSLPIENGLSLITISNSKDETVSFIYDSRKRRL
jgi:hypothetical protein